MDVLLTWVGARDPGWNNPRTKKYEPGPILSLLQHRRFDVVYLLLNLDSGVDNFRSRATDLLHICQRQFPSIKVRQKPVDLVSVTDYTELFRVTNDTCQGIIKEEGLEDRNYFVYLSPGTPQMQTVWVLLVQSGLVPARMIQGTPPDLLAQGVSPWKEVDLSLPSFPQVVNPGEALRLVGILQAQKDNLVAENRRLLAEAELLKTSANLIADEAIAEGFHLNDYLKAQERSFYVRALDQAGENAAKAARLLGVDPAAFRARAATLGIRSRAGRRPRRT